MFTDSNGATGATKGKSIAELFREGERKQELERDKQLDVVLAELGAEQPSPEGQVLREHDLDQMIARIDASLAQDVASGRLEAVDRLLDEIEQAGTWHTRSVASAYREVATAALLARFNS